MEAGVFAFVAFVAAFGCAFVVGRSVFLGLERAMAATRGIAYVSQKACVRGAVNGRGAGRFAASRARVRDAVCRMSLYYTRNGVASFLPFGRELSRRPLGNCFAMPRGWRREKESTQRPKGLPLFSSLRCSFSRLCCLRCFGRLWWCFVRWFFLSLCCEFCWLALLKRNAPNCANKFPMRCDAWRRACMRACRFRKRFPR